MTTLILDSAALKATAVQTTEDTLVVELADGRSISAPLGWYPRLFHGTVTEREHFRFIAGGERKSSSYRDTRSRSLQCMVRRYPCWRESSHRCKER